MTTNPTRLPPEAWRADRTDAAAAIDLIILGGAIAVAVLAVWFLLSVLGALR